MTKSADAFRTISEVATDLELPQHVLRFWETRFSQIKPMKRGGGRRYYRPDDVLLLRGIQFLLYDRGYTIKGVQRILKEKGIRHVIAALNGGMETTGLPNEPAGPIVAREPKPDIEAVTEMETGPRRTSKTVADYSDAKLETPGAGRGILDRFRSEKPQQSGDGGELVLSEADCQDLKATLYELLECKRLLDQTR